MQKDERSQIDLLRLKYVLWSIAMLILKYIFLASTEDLILLHKTQTNLITIYKDYLVPEIYRIFLKFCFSFEDNFFTDFYKL